MAYYNKKDIEDYIKNELETLDGNPDARLIVPISQPLSQLANEEDLVGFCYTILEENSSGLKLPTMKAKVFCRIDHDLYTDDRYAIDSYQAAQDGKSVVDVINARHQEQQQALRELTGEDLDSISQLYAKRNNAMDS